MDNGKGVGGLIMNDLIYFSEKGNFNKITSFFEKLREGIHLGILNKYGRQGVDALRSSTPVDTGLTSDSWYYKILQRTDSVELAFYNSNVNDGVNIAIILQYGHGTKNGGYVQGVDYINPAMRSIFERIADEAWKELIKL